MMPSAPFPAADGRMANLVRVHDWALTPLGPMESWSAALRVTVDAMLASRFPQCLFWGPDLIAIYNDGYEPMLGSKPMALGQPFRVTWSEAWEGLKPIADHAMAGEAAFFEDYPLQTDRSGKVETAYFTFCYSPVRDEEGVIRGIIDTVVETTEKVRGRERLQEEGDRFRRMLAHAPSFIAMLSGPEHRIEYANSAYLKLVGHRPVVGKTVVEILPDAVEQGYLDLLDRVFTTGEPYNATGALYAVQAEPDGPVNERYVDFIYDAIRDENGIITGVFLEGHDVTDRSLSQHALQISEQRFRSLAQAMPNHAWTADLGGKLNWFNDRVFEYSGLDNAHLLGEGWTSIVHPDDLPEAGRDWAHALAAHSVYETEFRIRRADGSYRWHIVRAVPLRDEMGVAVMWTGTNTDIEDQKRAAAELATLNASLEQEVAQRTKDLMAAEENLRQSQKMEAVGQLTGGLAHDFNNILAGISGSLELMQTRLAQGRIGDLDRYLTGAQGAAKRAAGLTQRLLAFSRRQTLDPKSTDLNRLVMGMQDLISRSVGPTVEVEAALAGGLWAAFVDSGQLENALLNLCINARDAMPDGGKLTIETANRWFDERAARQRGLTPGQYLSLCVSDTGTGMSPNVIQRAFDPFYTTKPTGQGTGLGLSMVHGFAGQSGGTAQIYSEIGQGAMVCIYLPRHDGVAEEEEQDLDLIQAPCASDHETILVVDDEPLVRMIAVELLEELGYNVIEAADGPSALRILNATNEIDLLVTDVGLPGGMNGRQLADAVRVSRPDLEVLFVTGYAENAVLNHGHLERGMHVMTKPFLSDAFARKVKDLLG